MTHDETSWIRAPINIGLVKYWGKNLGCRDLNLPASDSLSVTLPLYTHTQLTLYEKCACLTDAVLIETNGGLDRIRSESQIRFFDHLRKIRPESNNRYVFTTRNDIPTGVGLASSSSGYAAMTKCFAEMYNLTLQEQYELARIGSASAARSLEEGVSRLNRDGSVQCYMSDWLMSLPKMLIIVPEGDVPKKISSTHGMIKTQNQSLLWKLYQEADVPEKYCDAMLESIDQKDFPTFADRVMRSSRELHAMCLDADIVYLSKDSHEIINAVNTVNRSQKRLAFTFDAGPNALIIARSAEDMQMFKESASELLSRCKVIQV